MSWRELILLASRYKQALLLGSLLLLLQNILLLALPWVLGSFAASLFAAEIAIFVSIPLIMALLAFESVMKVLSTIWLAKLTACIARDVRQKVQQRLVHLPISVFDEGKRGDLIALLAWETDQLCSFLGGTLIGVVPQLITVMGAMLMMFSVQPWLALLVGGAIPLFYLLVKIVGRRLRPMAEQLRQAQSDAFVLLEEQLELIPLIKMFGRESFEANRYSQQLAKISALEVEQARTTAIVEPLLQFVSAAGVVLVLAVSGKSLGSENPAQLISFILYAALLTRPVSALAGVYGQVLAARGNLARLSAVLEWPLERDQGQVLDRVKGEIEFSGVSFTYPGRRQLFDKLQLRILPGETIAITGHNGSGKSTLVKLLVGLYTPAEGAIKLDGHDIALLSLRFLRSQITVVSQQQLLQNATIAENIAYGVPDATHEAIQSAARSAQASVFIEALPQGYDTLIGDMGVRLSGGQCQRIALARALLRRAPVLVLDEATAMFDPDGETELLKDFRQFLKGITVILITHRPASLALADRILLLEQGRVREMKELTPVVETRDRG